MMISVVTPSFNQDRFIEDTILSVLRQEGDVAVDYLIVDGGSNDGSVEIIRKYDDLVKTGAWPLKCRSLRYRWISEPDRGQVDALKKGFRLAEGDVFCWLNSDDVYTAPDVLARVAARFSREEDVDLLTADGTIIDEEGRTIGEHRVATINLKELLYLDYHILQPATFFRRRVYDEESLDETMTCAFDADFFIRLISRGVRFRKTDELLAGFRIYPGIKTFALAGRRYREQREIAREHSRSRFLMTVSSVYRYCEIVLRQRLPRHVFYALFAPLRALCYCMVVGRIGR